MTCSERNYYLWLWFSWIPFLLFLPFYFIVFLVEGLVAPVVELSDELMRHRWNIARRIRRGGRDEL